MDPLNRCYWWLKVASIKVRIFYYLTVQYEAAVQMSAIKMENCFWSAASNKKRRANHWSALALGKCKTPTKKIKRNGFLSKFRISSVNYCQPLLFLHFACYFVNMNEQQQKDTLTHEIIAKACRTTDTAERNIRLINFTRNKCMRSNLKKKNNRQKKKKKKRWAEISLVLRKWKRERSTNPVFSHIGHHENWFWKSIMFVAVRVSIWPREADKPRERRSRQRIETIRKNWQREKKEFVSFFLFLFYFFQRHRCDVKHKNKLAYSFKDMVIYLFIVQMCANRMKDDGGREGEFEGWKASLAKTQR